MTATEPGLTVAVAQIATVLGDVTANLDKHLDAIAKARAASVDVLVFPELSLTGYSLDVRARDIALHADDRLFHKIAQAGGPMAVTVGYVESGAARPYNAAMTVRDGRALANHRKLNLPGYGRLEEPKWFGGGEALDCFEIAPGWRAATLICADLWNPALVHLAACSGTSLLLAPISSAYEAVGGGFSNPHGWQVALDFYSMMYGLPILMANRVGREGTLNFWGGSRILDGFGRVVASAAGGECLVAGRLRAADVEKARGLLPTVRDSDPVLVRTLFDRLFSGRSAA